MDAADAVRCGREAFERGAWAEAYHRLASAERDAPLDAGDLERLATAAYLVGSEPESIDAWARAHRERLRLGDHAAAARCAFWLGLGLLLKGDIAQANGWLARARRVLGDTTSDCVEHGYLLVPTALGCLDEGDPAAAHAAFTQAAACAARFGDRDLMALAQLGQGQALIALREAARGVALLDEVMVAVTAGEVAPVVAGIVYCAVIEACHDTFDLRRAREWTAALARWCDAQPDLVAYRGQCLVHRAEILQLHGAWSDAVAAARAARERLSDPPGQAAVATACYQQGELHRLRGELAEAEQAYLQASRWGRIPRPGLALLRLAQGQVEAAEASIRRVMDEAHDRVARSKVLAAVVEIELAAGDITAARTAADELSEMARDLDAPLLQAVSAHATGAVLHAEGDARAALGELRRAWTTWEELEAPYDAARTRVLIGLCCQALGDDDGGHLEFDAACVTFERLGAAPDLARARALARPPGDRPAGLTRRELEVLRLVSSGKSNQAIATELVISRHTVARHVQNIFTKLGVTSRAAAVAFAFEHELV